MARTAQTGLTEGLDYVGKQYITPKKSDKEEDYDEENVVSVDVPTPTKEETEIASRQEKFEKAIKTAKGGKKRRHVPLRKTKKVIRRRKQK
jgi:hypothetical protein